MTANRWAAGVGLVLVLAVVVAAKPKQGTILAGMVLVGTLIYQQRHKTGLWAVPR